MLRYLSKARIRGQRVLLRVDFNVPIAGATVEDDFDLIRVLPTIQALRRWGNVSILLSHHSAPHQSLAPVAPRLAKLLGSAVTFLRNPFTRAAALAIRRAKPGAVLLVENLRLWKGERANVSTFARSLARLGEAYVNDAFGESHRPYASMVGIPRMLPSFAGPLIAAELKMLNGFLREPKRPLVGIIGGAKLTTKIPLLRRFNRIAEHILVGGAVANALLAARGERVGRMPAEGRIPGIGVLARSARLMLPIDAVVGGWRGERARTVSLNRLGTRDAMYDIGRETQRMFCRTLGEARTVIWNGPLGLVEVKQYRQGTAAVARVLAQGRARILVGGGDTVAFLHRLGLLGKFKYVSTGGGAMLAYLAGEKLPGLEALKHGKHEA